MVLPCVSAPSQAGPCSEPVVTDLAEQPLSCGRASSQAPLGAALLAGFQKLRGQDIFSIQTIRFLRPLIAQVGEGKVTAVQEGSSCLSGSAYCHQRPLPLAGRDFCGR